MGFEILGGLFSLVGFICWVCILIAAFSDEVWKGVASLFCWVYMLYYVIVEFDNPNKWLLLAGGIFASGLGSALINLGSGGLHPGRY